MPAATLSVPEQGLSPRAGEQCSLYHAWIQGALESGIRAARQIHEASVELVGPAGEHR